MKERYVYHVVTERPMQVGQHIIFDRSHHSGVWARVNDRLDIVNDIYADPAKYGTQDLDHHTLVAVREMALEEMRQNKYPGYPSRMGCLYVSDTLDEARRWGKLFVEWGRPTYCIVRLKVRGNYFRGDANNCFEARLDKTENLKLAEHYWENRPNVNHEEPLWEILVDGDIEVIEIVGEINANME